LAAEAASPAGPHAAGAAAAGVFAEVEAHARRTGADPATFPGLAGAGALVAAVTSPRNRTLGQDVEARDTLPLLAHALTAGGRRPAGVGALADLVEGGTTADDWIAALPTPTGRVRTAA
jgi:glycerol-3-phosphate dehydrogenase